MLAGTAETAIHNINILVPFLVIYFENVIKLG